jgi:DNA-directed RNA polymerase I, II, and III subunit RPABC2
MDTFVLREAVVEANSVARVTLPYFTKYEYTTFLACRMQHLALGAPPLVPLSDFSTSDPRFLQKVAEREILERKLPYLIRRKLPDGTTEYWPVSELELAW